MVVMRNMIVFHSCEMDRMRWIVFGLGLETYNKRNRKSKARKIKSQFISLSGVLTKQVINVAYFYLCAAVKTFSNFYIIVCGFLAAW